MSMWEVSPICIWPTIWACYRSQPLDVIYAARSKPSARIERWVLDCSHMTSTFDTYKGSLTLPICKDIYLTFSVQVDQVICKVDVNLGVFWHGRQNLTFPAKGTFYLSTIQSSIDYVSLACVHLLTSAQYNWLVITSNQGMKTVFGLAAQTPTHIIIVLQHTLLYPVEHRFNLKPHCCLMIDRFMKLESCTQVCLEVGSFPNAA